MTLRVFSLAEADLLTGFRFYERQIDSRSRWLICGWGQPPLQFEACGHSRPWLSEILRRNYSLAMCRDFLELIRKAQHSRNCARIFAK